MQSKETVLYFMELAERQRGEWGVVEHEGVCGKVPPASICRLLVFFLKRI